MCVLFFRLAFSFILGNTLDTISLFSCSPHEYLYIHMPITLIYISFNITLACLWCIEGVHLFWYPSHHLRNEAQFSSLLVRNFCSWPQVVAMSFRLRCGCNCIMQVLLEKRRCFFLKKKSDTHMPNSISLAWGRYTIYRDS